MEENTFRRIPDRITPTSAVWQLQKDVLIDEVCYTSIMNTSRDARTIKQQESCEVGSAQTNLDPQTVRMHEDCAKQPMARAIHLIGDPWVLLIVINLLQGSLRFNELLDAMGRVSSKTLSQRLKALEMLGMVERRAFYEIPPRVEYNLTEKGRDLAGIIGAIEQFAQKHLSDIEESSCS